MGHSDLNLTTNRYMDATQLAVADAIGKLPRLLSTGGTHIGTQISGPEGQNKAQPDAGGFGNPKQKPLKTGAQVALWREETQSKLVEAVGVETQKYKLPIRLLAPLWGLYAHHLISVTHKSTPQLCKFVQIPGDRGVGVKQVQHAHIYIHLGSRRISV